MFVKPEAIQAKQAPAQATASNRSLESAVERLKAARCEVAGKKRKITQARSNGCAYEQLAPLHGEKRAALQAFYQRRQEVLTLAAAQELRDNPSDYLRPCAVAVWAGILDPQALAHACGVSTAAAAQAQQQAAAELARKKGVEGLLEPPE